jgi:hypothetical protein
MMSNVYQFRVPAAVKALFLILGSLVFPGLSVEAQPGRKNPESAKNPIFERIMPAPVGGGFAQENYWVWGSSVIRGEDGRYHMFVSRWRKELPFHPGWQVGSEIVHAVAEKPEGPYAFTDVALPDRGAQYWDGHSTHNPKITRYQDTYVLFYMGSTHPFEAAVKPDTLTLQSAYTTVSRSNKRIGIATSKSLDGPWERYDAPVLDTKPGTFYSFFTSNPAPWINADGSVVLIFKARAYEREHYPYQGDMTIGVARAPHFRGPYTVVGNEPIFGEARGGEIEDPFLWRDDAGYHLLAKDQRGRVSGQFQSGILLHSPDGVHWQVDKNPLAYSRTIQWSDGSTQTMGQLERVFGLIENGKLTHLFFGTMDGPGGFDKSTRSWNMVVPLRPE